MEKLTHQPKELVNEKGDMNELTRRRLTAKICVAWGFDWFRSKSLPDKNFFDSFKQQSRPTRHPSQLNGANYRVRHIIWRRTPPPPKQNLSLISSGKINFFLDLGPFPISWDVEWRFTRVGSQFLKIQQKSGIFFFLSFESLARFCEAQHRRKRLILLFCCLLGIW